MTWLLSNMSSEGDRDMSISLEEVRLGIEVGVGLGSVCDTGAYVKYGNTIKQKTNSTIYSGKSSFLFSTKISTSGLTTSGRSSGPVWTSSGTSSWRLSG